MRELVLIGGGVRSGKSALALQIAHGLGQRRVFIATAQPFDAEMRQRISRHQEERGRDFTTLEVPHALPEAIVAQQDTHVVVVDCLTLWLSNRLLQDSSEAQMLAHIANLADALRARPAHTVLVTNEVGMGIVPETSLGRAFRDLAGKAHQAIAPLCTQLYAALLGCTLRLRPGPVELVSPLALTSDHGAP